MENIVEYGIILMIMGSYFIFKVILKEHLYKFHLYMMQKDFVLINVIVFSFIPMVVKNLKAYYYGIYLQILILHMNMESGNFLMKLEF